jgi:methylated-DNA-[protein]-cysteine S-methyltransferase
MISYSHLKHLLIDKLLLIANPTELIGIYFADWKHAPVIQSDWKLNPRQPILKEATRQIQDYLNGQRTKFSIPLHFEGTGFQRKVWEQLRSIPFGETISYSELAKRVGNPRAVRAAGSANGKNPFCIIVPCHRVIAKDGTIGGYAGGLARKRHLLAVEK